LSHNIYELFATKFSDSLTSPFLNVPGGLTYSYGQVDRRSAAMAAALAEGGARPGDRVVVQVDKSADAVALYLACLRGGFVYVPLNTAYTPEEVGFFLGDADPAVFVFKPGRASKLKPVADIAGVPKIFTLSNRSTGTLAEAASSITPIGSVMAREPDDVACMVYTSGTTGRSKGAMLTHRGIATNARALHAIWRFRPGDVLLHCLPIFHIHGLFIALHCAMLNASEVLFLPKFDADEVKAALPHSTVMMGVPTHYRRLLADPEFGSADCQTIRLFVSGSAPLAEPVFHEFIARTGHTICERYGMTETGIIASNPPEGQRIAGTVGYALPEMEMRVADEKDEPLGAGEIGEVQVRGPHVFPGYWGLEDKTAESLTGDGFFRTGDQGSMGADGRLTLVGRSTDMIISGGYNVYPKEIELVVDSQDGVTESAVVGLPHPDFGEAVTAFVVADESVDEETLEQAVEDRLANYKRPKRYVFLSSLPRNAMGKVQKAQLREAYAELHGPVDI
jgi:malonyl-CoA/methylmalonyl-CoA synthetase